MNYYKLFYWITVAERVQTFILALAIAFTVLLVANAIVNLNARYNIVYGYSNDEEKGHTVKKTTNRFFSILLPGFFIFWIFFIAVPSKSDTVLIVAGGAMTTFATSDSSARKIPADVMSFVHEKIQELTREAKADLGQPDPKTKKLDELKKLTSDEIVERLKTDTSISKLVQ
jgi:hypothetical protein